MPLFLSKPNVLFIALITSGLFTTTSTWANADAIKTLDPIVVTATRSEKN